MLARHKLPPHQLTLELTETAALAGSGTAVEILAALRDLGVTISIDDYGTGLSTLDYLKKIPASEIGLISASRCSNISVVGLPKRW